MAVTFDPGRLLITTHAQRVLDLEDVRKCIIRHLNGDWGDLCPEDRKENEFSLKEGFRLLSSYRDRHNVKFWIITEADRSATTVLLPEDY